MAVVSSERFSGNMATKPLRLTLVTTDHSENRNYIRNAKMETGTLLL
jgi:hypothetical protein